VIYWTDRGDPPRGNTVNRALMDAASRSRKGPEIIFNHLMEGIGLSLDPREQSYVPDRFGRLRLQRQSRCDRIRKICSSSKEICLESHTQSFLRVPSLAPISLNNYEEGEL